MAKGISNTSRTLEYLRSQGWMAVEDGLPDIKQGSINVIVYCPIGHANDRLKSIHFFIPKGKKTGRFGTKGVTHWMPLPSPPVKDQVIEKYIARTKADEPCFGDEYVVKLYENGRDIHGAGWKAPKRA